MSTAGAPALEAGAGLPWPASPLSLEVPRDERLTIADLGLPPLADDDPHGEDDE